MLNKIMYGAAIVTGITGAAMIYIAKTRGDVLIGLGGIFLAAGATFNIAETGRV